jgi:hypothetical protein
MQEYDLDIKSIKTIKGTRLVDLITKSHALVIAKPPLIKDLIAYKEMDEKLNWPNNHGMNLSYIHFFINSVCPLDMDNESKITLKLKPL